MQYGPRERLGSRGTGEPVFEKDLLFKQIAQKRGLAHELGDHVATAVVQAIAVLLCVDDCEGLGRFAAVARQVDAAKEERLVIGTWPHQLIDIQLQLRP